MVFRNLFFLNLIIFCYSKSVEDKYDVLLPASVLSAGLMSYATDTKVSKSIAHLFSLAAFLAALHFTQASKKDFAEFAAFYICGVSLGEFFNFYSQRYYNEQI